jgi:hypothetical protein
MSRFAVQQIRFNNTLYPGVSGWSYDPGDNINSDQLDSTVQETAHHHMQTGPTADLATRDLGFLATLNGSTDIWQKAMDGTNGLVLIGGKANANAPGYQAGTVHVARTGLRGSLFGTGINWSKGGKAELALRGMMISANGTTAAVSDALVALPTAPDPDFGWVVSALTLDGDSIGAAESVGVTVDPKAGFDYLAGLPEPTDVLMAGVNGAAMWRLAASIGDCDLGGNGTGAVSVVYRRLATGGGFSVAASSTLTVTFNSAWSVEGGIGGQAGSPMARSILVRPRQNGATKPVTWAFT